MKHFPLSPSPSFVFLNIFCLPSIEVELTSRDVGGLVVHAVLCRDRVVVVVHRAAAGRGRGGGGGGGPGGQGVTVHEELGLVQRRRVRRRSLKERGRN